MKEYDGWFRVIFREIYEAQCKAKFETAEIYYEHR